MASYFVTGATGVVGSALLGRLLQDPETRVFALTRATTQSGADERIAATVAAIPQVRQIPGAASRVKAVAGDVEAPDFGLTPAALDSVMDNCERVCHCAGVVRLTLPLSDARRAALGAAHNVVALLRAMRQRGRMVKCEYVSTVGVGGRDTRMLPETWLDGARRFHNTYEQAKAEAEDVLRSAVDEGLPLTVHRPSMVVGDSRTGWIPQFQVFYHLVEFLLGTRTRGVFPDFAGARLDTIPSDVVAAAIAWSSRSTQTNGRVLNLCSGPDGSIPLTRLRELARDAAKAHGVEVPAVRTVPRRAFRLTAATLRLFVRAPLRRALANLPLFLDYLDSDQKFTNDETRRLLSSAAIAIPSAESYTPRILEFYFRARKP